MKRIGLIFIVFFSCFSTLFGANKAVFIHGFGGGLESWGKSGTIDYLKSQQVIDSYINFAYDVSKQAVEEIVKSFIQTIGYNNRPGDKWILVGHSLGGLIARYAAPELRSRGIQVVGILTVAAPHQGASAADILQNDAAAIVDQFTAEAQAGPNYGPHSRVNKAMKELEPWIARMGTDFNSAQVYEIPHFLDAARDKAYEWIKMARDAEAETKLVPENGTLIRQLNNRTVSVAHRSVIGTEKSPTIIRRLS